jgi:hypothetical protein
MTRTVSPSPEQLSELLDRLLKRAEIRRQIPGGSPSWKVRPTAYPTFWKKRRRTRIRPIRDSAPDYGTAKVRDVAGERPVSLGANSCSRLQRMTGCKLSMGSRF